MNKSEYEHLLSALKTAEEILGRHRTPDPTLVTAYDTVKQARARVITALAGQIQSTAEVELVAA